jgi:hypothetical protein
MRPDVRSAVCGAVRTAVSPFRAAALVVISWFSPRTRVRGIQLIDLSVSDRTPLFFERVTEALELIAAVHPRRLARVQTYLKRIVLVAGGGEYFYRSMRAYVMDVPNLSVRSGLQVAMAIVHEATHARLNRMGIRYPSVWRGRIEAICVAAERDFAERVPGSGELVAQTLRKLSDPWWTDEALHERHVDLLRSYGWPPVLLRAYKRVFAPRRASDGR